MLHRAAVRKAYDELIQAELTTFLEKHPSTFDLIISADTLVYFGDLTPVFVAAHAALRPGGSFIFTVERAPDTDRAPFRLNPHGRYSHTEAAVRSLLGASGFAVRDLKEEVLRKESGHEVAGLVVVARRS